MPDVPCPRADLPDGALDSASAGASMLDAWGRTDYGRNVLSHALVQLQRDGWLRQEPAAFTPARGDAVEAWLRAHRDSYDRDHDRQWPAIDEMLDDYRLHADTGTPLDQHCCEGGNVDDCAGCHDTKKERA